ncbi:MAG: C10 family peptidase [Planctomycetota bacterium]
MKSSSMCLIGVLVAFLLCSTSGWAAPTTAQQAQMAVAGWLRADPRPMGAVLGGRVSRAETFTDAGGQPIYHIVYLDPSGFVIVPADDLVEPIIGFVSEGTYDPSPQNPLGALVSADVGSRIAAVRDIQALGAQDAAAYDNQAKWQGYIDLADDVVAAGLASISDVRVAPLVRTKWAQQTCCSDPNLACYNYYTPPFEPNDPDNYPCGCVATAMAQVMRYHQHPTAGIGVHNFPITVVGDANFTNADTRGGDGMGGPYNWGRMVYEPDCNTTGDQREAIGALCYDAGVSVKMSYSKTSSAANMFDAKLSLINVFNYSNAFYGYNGGNNMPLAQLISMINPNLDFSHPVIIAIAQPSQEHAVVVDGYGYYTAPIIPPPPPTMYHHVNMGWAGLFDAWYNFCADMPPGYTIVIACIYNILISGTGEIISGRVTDAQGQPLSGVLITAERTGGGVYNSSTDANGIYALAALPSASTYTISAQKTGYDFADRVVANGASVDGLTFCGNLWGINFVPFAGAIFVDASAPGQNDGSTWTDAYRHLRDALDAASSGDTILVAEATYKPDANSAVPGGSGDRDANFLLVSGAAMYGGWPSGGANSWAERDPTAYETILSGDIGTAGVNSDNSYHVLIGTGTDSNTILDGFTVTAGRANGGFVSVRLGGGLYTETAGSCTVRNCVFRQNHAYYNGGGIANNWCIPAPTVTNCVFRENSAGMYGAGIYNGGCGPTISKCTFVENYAYDGGGGIGNYESSNTTVVNCAFYGNSVHYIGGAIYNWNWLYTSSPSITNCAFSGNSANNGGAVANLEAATATVTNCTINNNSAVYHGGGVFNENSSPILDNCVLWDNNDTDGIDESAQIHTVGGAPIVRFSCIQDDDPNDPYVPFGGAANNNIDDDPLFVDADGPDGTIGTEDDNSRLESTSPCIDVGDNNSVPPDTADLDGDANVLEPTPLDLDESDRFADGDCNDSNVVDMGAYERWIYCHTCWDPAECAGQPSGDATCDGEVNLADLFELKQHFGKSAPWTPPECCADFTQDGSINLADLFALKAGFGSGPYAPSTANQDCP